jgi:hypothetical protein
MEKDLWNSLIAAVLLLSLIILPQFFFTAPTIREKKDN